MRVNVHSEDLTTDTTLVERRAENGKTYIGVRMHAFGDGRSAVTFWAESREELGSALDAMLRKVQSGNVDNAAGQVGNADAA